LSAEAKKETLFLLRFDEDDAAGLMTPRYIAVKPSITVAQALKFVRKGAEEIETVYYFYVLDQLKRLIGVVSLRDILAASDEQIIAGIMETDIISVHEDTDQEEVAKTLQTYSLLAVPVVDKNNVLLGIVTFDDVIEVIHEEQTEDVYRMVAMGGDPLPYLESSVFDLVKRRIPWLTVLLIVGTITTNVLHHYEDIIIGAAFLFMFMPVITQTGGNAGSQSTTLIIRGLATEELYFKDVWKVLRKELMVGFIMGIGTGIVVFARGILLPPGINFFQAFAISLSLCFVVLFSTTIGAIAPLLIHKTGHDPTVMSGPLMATVIDVCGLTIYFELAKYLLHI
ncbi:MAG: magnesium transporter, partial [Spirochaetia bacterium]|nr:magnesium transporter [Spirochaetia bacterium]